MYGGAGIVKQARLAARAHILVATPGRLLDLIDRRDVSLDRVRLLVLDEADRMLDMGFKPVVDRIVKMCARERQTLLFSATLQGEVGKVAKAYTTNPRRHEHAHSEERKGDVEHRFVSVSHEGKVARLVSELNDSERGLTLVFVRTKRGADRLVKRLAQSNVQAVAMHGDKSQAQREKALARFESGAVDTLVATDVAARGIDVAGITHVINFDIPGSREDYVHRIGRTARAGASGTGVTFVVHDQARELVEHGARPRPAPRARAGRPAERRDRAALRRLTAAHALRVAQPWPRAVPRATAPALPGPAPHAAVLAPVTEARRRGAAGAALGAPAAVSGRSR